MILRSPGGNEVFKDIGSVGTGLNGRAYRSKTTNRSVALLGTTIVMQTNPLKEVVIRILDDRVYWPCSERR